MVGVLLELTDEVKYFVVTAVVRLLLRNTELTNEVEYFVMAEILLSCALLTDVFASFVVVGVVVFSIEVDLPSVAEVLTESLCDSIVVVAVMQASIEVLVKPVLNRLHGEHG